MNNIFDKSLTGDIFLIKFIHIFFWLGYVAVVSRASNPVWPFDTIIPIKTIEGIQARSVFVGKTDQLYILSLDNEILKIDSSGILWQRYNNKYLGRPQFIYLENPLQLVLFYPDYQTVIILDQWMSEIKRMKLTDFGVPFVRTIGIGPDRSIWYYDDQVKRLKKLGPEGNILFESTILITEDNAALESIVVRKTDLIIQAISGTVYVLNLFGQLKNKIMPLGYVFKYAAALIYIFDRELQAVKTFSVPEMEAQHSFLLPKNLGHMNTVQIINDRMITINDSNQVQFWKFNY